MRGSFGRASAPGLLLVGLVVTLCAGGFALAAPLVNSVQGNVQNAQTITVTGTAFGASGPRIAIFDDFENGVDGQDIQPANARVGQWSSIWLHPKYSSLYRYSGRFAARMDANSDVSNPTAYDILTQYFPDTTDVFVSVWRFIPPGEVVPGTGSPNGTNWKFVWVYYGENLEHDSFFGQSEPRSEGRSDAVVYGNNACAVRHDPTNYWTSMFTHGRWVRMQLFMHGASDNTGQIFVWEIPWYNVNDGYNSTGQMLRLNGPNDRLYCEGGRYNRVGINAYCRGPAPVPTSHPTFDDVYIASGPNARARVEIASARTWGDNAHAADMNMTLCTPNTWSDTSLTCTVWQGSFPDGAQGYLFVIDGRGVVSDQDPNTPGAQGFPVTFAPGAPNSPPAAPTQTRRDDIL